MWTWTALDADSKLIVSYLVGGRDAGYANAFMDDVASRLANRVQLTTDGHKAYLDAVDDAFGADVDYAMLVKMYGEAPHPPGRYSPSESTGIKKTRIEGRPDPAHVSTSYVERQNLTMRMQMRSIHSADQRLLQARDATLPHGGSLHGLVQFCPHSQDVAGCPGNGGRLI